MGGEGFNGEVWRARLRGPLLCPQPDMAMALEAAHGLDRQAPGLSARQTLSLKQRQIATRSLLVLTVLTLMMPELPGILTILVVPPAFVAIILFRLFLLAVAARKRSDASAHSGAIP
jgi:hypothetical protein